jgi:hypothetical protein
VIPGVGEGILHVVLIDEGGEDIVEPCGRGQRGGAERQKILQARAVPGLDEGMA